MKSFIEKKIANFIERINTEAVVQRGDGKVGVDSSIIGQIVKDEGPETIELVVKSYCAMAQANPSLYQMAAMLAGIYQIEFGSDKLIQYVQKEAGDSPIEIGIQQDDGASPTQATVSFGQDDRAIRILVVEDEDLQTGNVSTFQRIFKELEALPQEVRKQHGKIALSFPQYDNDQRPDFMIPEIRRFIQNLDNNFPHFLYYIFPEPEAAQVLIYGFSLLPLEDFTLQLGKWRYHGTQDDIIAMLIPRIKAISGFCKRFSDNPNPIVKSLLKSFFQDDVLETVFQRMQRLTR